MGAWCIKFCLGLAEISSFAFLVLFKDGTRGETRVSSFVGLWSKRCCDHNRGML